MAVHLGQVLVDVQASDPTAQLLPLGETLSLPVRLLGHAAPGDILLSPQVGRLVEGWFELQGGRDPRGQATLRHWRLRRRGAGTALLPAGGVREAPPESLRGPGAGAGHPARPPDAGAHRAVGRSSASSGSRAWANPACAMS